MNAGYVWHETCPCCDGDGKHDVECTLEQDCPDVYQQLARLWELKRLGNDVATKAQAFYVYAVPSNAKPLLDAIKTWKAAK